MGSPKASPKRAKKKGLGVPQGSIEAYQKKDNNLADTQFNLPEVEEEEIKEEDFQQSPIGIQG